MLHRLKSFFSSFKKNFQIDVYDKKKIVLSAFTFFFIIGAYSILRSLKTSIFLGFVGKEYQPIAKILSIVIMIPVMLLYSKLIDKLKRYQAVYFFLIFYAILGIIFSYFFFHPTFGIKNTQTSPYRILGWLFEFSMDMFQGMVVGTFWAFVNSISTPDFASKNYGLIVAASRFGGISTTLISWLLLERSSLASWQSIPLLTLFAALLLLAGGLCIRKLISSIPESHLHGYQAAYDANQTETHTRKKPGVFEGLKLLLTEPYVLGIFGLVYSFEIINTIFDYQMQVLMSLETNNNVQAMSSFMFIYTGTFQALSFFFAMFGTSHLLKRIGLQKCLLIMPIVSILLTIILMIHPKLITVFIAMVILRALNYGFNQPIREILYIPTVKDIQFKSKAWIDSFGRTLSKTSGSAVNMFAIFQNSSIIFAIESACSIGVASIWTVIAFFVGRTYLNTIKSNKVIGKK